MPASNSKVWSAQELQTFLDIVGDSVIQRGLDEERNDRVYKDIRQRMLAEGFERTSEECRVKLKKLKGKYGKIKDENSRSGKIGSTWRWYDAMDAIYGHRPANRAREGGLDSAAAPRGSIMEPVGDRRRSQLDVRSLMEEMQAADERQLERMESLYERQFEVLHQDAQAARRQEVDIARQQMEDLATFNRAFLGVLGQLVEVLQCSRDPTPPPTQ